MLYLSYRGLCFGWGWNCYLLLEGFEDAPEGYSFRCNCFLKDWLELLLSLLTSSTNLPGQPENRSPRIKSSIFVVWELRDYNKILEKADMKRYWFWRLCVLYNWVKINTFSCRPFLRRRLLVATKITNIDDLILRLRLFTHPGKFLFILFLHRMFLDGVLFVLLIYKIVVIFLLVVL